MSRTRGIVMVLLAGATAVLFLGTTLGHGKQDEPKTWTTVFKSPSPFGIEGLTLDDDGYLYVPQRVTGATCNIVRIDSDGGANQTGVVVARMDPPCNPAGLAFGPDERLYLSGFGAAGDIGVVTPSAVNPPPTATLFATLTPGANGLAFDSEGNLYVSDGNQNQGRVYRVGPGGGEAKVLFRVQPMMNAAGVGRQNQALQPGALPGNQNIVANGLAFDRKGNLFIADTARGAIWRVEIDKHGNLIAPLGCDTTFVPETLCLDALFAQHPALDGADGIALDRDGNIWVAANERNAIVVVDKRGRVEDLFRNPAAPDPMTGLRNAGPLEFPTSPVIAGRTFCTTSSDGSRRDNAPNTAGEAGGTTGFAGKVSCLDQRLRDKGLELPVD